MTGSRTIPPPGKLGKHWKARVYAAVMLGTVELLFVALAIGFVTRFAGVPYGVV